MGLFTVTELITLSAGYGKMSLTAVISVVGEAYSTQQHQEELLQGTEATLALEGVSLACLEKPNASLWSGICALDTRLSSSCQVSPPSTV